MDLSIFLAKLFGIYFILLAIIYIFKKNEVRDLIKGIRDNRVMISFIGYLQIIAGLAIIITHNIFSLDFRGVITIFGYWLIVEGILYIVLPKKTLRKIINTFSNTFWYAGGSIIAIILGVYLVLNGFGW